MKIKAIKNYRDLQLNENIEKGNEYEVTNERAKEIIRKGYAVEVKDEPIQNQTVENKKRTSTKKG